MNIFNPHFQDDRVHGYLRFIFGHGHYVEEGDVDQVTAMDDRYHFPFAVFTHQFEQSHVLTNTNTFILPALKG